MNGNDLDESLRKDWEEAQGFRDLPSRISKKMFSNISEEIFRRKRSLPLRISISVAASILVAICGLLLTNKPVQVRHAVFAQQLATVSDLWIVERNEMSQVREIEMPDGSTVKLESKSSIRFTSAYNNQDRRIWLSGEAEFTVKKDKQRPFVVKSGAYSTTALGTVFSVTEQRNGVKVKLYSGKVVIRNENDELFLNPGEQAMLGNGTRQVKKFGSFAKKSAVKNLSLKFEQAPLNEVLDALQSRYHTTIERDALLTAGKYFTGTIETNDSLSSILRIIAVMNGFKVSESPSGYTIK